VAVALFPVFEEGSMNTIKTIVRSMIGLGVIGAMPAVGCFDWADDCELSLTCPLEPTSSSGTGGGGTSPGCIPSENDQPIDDDCGVFVSSSKGDDTGGKGTKAAPYKTLATAVSKANDKPIYACAEALTGSVMLSTGATIYGGLDCTKGWAYIGATTKSMLTGDVDAPALMLASNASGTTIEDFMIQAANATKPGSSSIAVLVDGAMVSLTRCDLVAGDGAIRSGWGRCAEHGGAERCGWYAGRRCVFGGHGAGWQWAHEHVRS